jgi:hypothetical protein
MDPSIPDINSILKESISTTSKQNITIYNNLVNLLNNHFSQNLKYHLLWLFFHSFSFAYPENPSDDYKMEIADFIVNVVPFNLGGCGGCQNDFKLYIKTVNIFRVVSSRTELSNFFYNFHNHINAKKHEFYKNKTHTFKLPDFDLEKAINVLTYEDVKHKYEETDYITLLEEKYDINMFKLIENKTLSTTFYQKINQIDFNTVTSDITISINMT